MDISFLNSEQSINTETQVDTVDLAKDFRESVKRKPIRKPRRVVEPDPEPQEEVEVLPTAQETESLRSIMHIYVSYWPDKLPQYNHKNLHKLSYDELKEARALFDAHVGDGKNVQSAVDAFYMTLSGIEELARPLVNLDGLSEIARLSKDLDDDVKYIFIQMCEKSRLDPKLRLIANLTKVVYQAYRMNVIKAMMLEEARKSNVMQQRNDISGMTQIQQPVIT